MGKIFAVNVEDDLVEELIKEKKPSTVVWSRDSVYMEW